MSLILTIHVLIIIIATEATTEIITKSELFKPLRAWLFKKGNEGSKPLKFLHALLDCGYCTSVWVSLFMFCSYLVLPQKGLILVLSILVIHRLSNLFHNIMDRIKGDEV